MAIILNYFRGKKEPPIALIDILPVLISPFFCLFMLQMVGLAILVTIIVWIFWRIGRDVLFAFSIAWVVLFLLPIDFAVRASDHFRVRVVDVVISPSETAFGIQAKLASGLKLNEDFVIYRRTSFPSPSYALLICIPCERRLWTPLFNDYKTPFGIGKREATP